MSSERAQWEDVKNNYLLLIQQSLASLNHPRRFEILGNVEEHLERKYAELPKEKRTWESYQQIITEMGPPAEYAALLCDDIRHAHRAGVNWGAVAAAIVVVLLVAAGAYLITQPDTKQIKTENQQKQKQAEVESIPSEPKPPVVPDQNMTVVQTPPAEPKAYIISFRTKSLAGFTTYRELLEAFNQNHPQGVRTHHYRTQVQHNRLIGYICTDNQAGVKALSEMLAKSDTLEQVDIKAATDAEFEMHCQLRQVDLPPYTPEPGQEKIVGIWVVDSNQMDIEQNRIIEQAKRENAGNPEALAQIEELNNHLRKDREMFEWRGLQFEADGAGFFYPISLRASERNYFQKLNVFLWGFSSTNSVRIELYSRSGTDEKPQRWDFIIENNHLVINCPKRSGDTLFAKYGFDRYYYVRISPDDPLSKKPLLFDPKCVKFTPPDGYSTSNYGGFVGIPAEGKIYHDAQRPQEEIKICFMMGVSDIVQVKLDHKDLLTKIIDTQEQKSHQQTNTLLISKDIQSLDGWPAGVIQYEVQPEKDKLYLREYYLVDSGATLMIISIYAPNMQRLDELDGYVKKIKLNMSDGCAMSRDEILKALRGFQEEKRRTEQSNRESLQQIQQSSVPKQYPAAEPSVFGKWNVVDYVAKMEDFVPDQRQWQKNFVLKTLEFVEPSTVYWSFNNNVVKQTSFGKTAVETVNGYSARYTLKTIDGCDYLFVDWMTVDVVEGKQAAWKYVLKRECASPAVQAYGEQPEETASGIVNNPNVRGKWTSVDFVREMDQFNPSERSWNGSLYLTGLEFQNSGQVWFSFNNGSRFPHTWVPGKVETGESRPAFYTVKNFDGNLYMFFEWISGDVTMRGQKPYYYVLKKAGASQISGGKTSDRKIIIGANYCTMNFIESKFGPATKREEKMLRYPAKGVDFGFFNSQLLLSEVHLNQGYQGQLKTGISLTSTTDDVFRAYGSPLRILQADDLHGIKEDRILYQKGDMSRIYYGKHGLIFWFRDEKVIQIVIFNGEAEIEF